MDNTLTIYNAKGEELLTTPINEGCKWKYELMKDDYITVKFALEEAKHFGMGSYTEWNSETWIVTKVQDPTCNTSTGGYDYELTFKHDYWLWQNKIFKFTPEYGGREASWSWCADLATLMQVFLKNLSVHGYKYKGSDYTVSIDSSVTSAAKTVTFANTGLIDALGLMCEESAWDCEWWIEEGVIHFGKCQDNVKDPVDFIVGKNVEKISRSNSKSDYITRLYVFGGEQNVPARYRKSLIFTADKVENGTMTDAYRVLHAKYFSDNTYKHTDKGSFTTSPETYKVTAKGTIVKINSTNKELKAGTYRFDLSALDVSFTYANTTTVAASDDYFVCKVILNCQVVSTNSDDEYTTTDKTYTLETAKISTKDTIGGKFTFSDGIELDLLQDTNYAYLSFEFTTPEMQGEIDYTVKISRATVTLLDTNPETAVKVKFLTGSLADGKTEYDCVNNAAHTEDGRSVITLPSNVTPSVGDTYAITNILTSKVPVSYFTADVTSDLVVNGVVQDRIMLPLTWKDGKNYIDITDYLDDNGDPVAADTTLADAEIVEGVVTNDNIYPRFTSKDEDGNNVNGRPCTDVKHRSRDVYNEETEETETINYWAFQDTSLTFSRDYLLDGKDLQVTFQSGLLNGMTFNVDFIADGTDYDEYGEGQWFEIVRSDDYGRYLPNDVLCPATGDRYVLTGWDASFLTELGLVDAAELELLKWGIDYIKDTMIDPSTYTCDMMSDDAYGKNPTTNELDENYAMVKTLLVGDRVKLFSDAYFKDGYRLSRVIGFERCLDLLYDTPQYIVGETASYSTLGALGDSISELTLKGQTYIGSGNGSNLYVIRSGDSTTATDRNVYSALKSLQLFLNKTKADTMSGLLTLLQGLALGDTGRYGITADGVATLKQIVTDLLQAGEIRTDYLTVTKSAHFFELVIDKMRSSSGTFINTAANCTIDKVQELTDTDGSLTGWRCYFRASDADGKSISNEWAEDDQAICYTNNLAEGTSYNKTTHYWWRLVTATGTEDTDIDGETYTCHYIDVSATDYDKGTYTELESGTPQEGDAVSQLGNRTDNERRGAIILAAYNTPDISIESPSYVQYVGIDNYNLTSHKYTWFAKNGNHIEGDLYVTSGIDGETSVSTLLSVLQDKIYAEVEGLRSEVNSDLGYLQNPAFSNGSKGWQLKTEATMYLIGDGWIWANGTVLSKKGDRASLTEDDLRRVMYLKNSSITQKNADFRSKPEFETDSDGNNVSMPVYASFFCKALTAGTLTVGFTGATNTDDTLTVIEEVAASDEYIQKVIYGLQWNGTGDFYISYTGEMYLYTIVLTTDKATALEYRYKTLFEMSERLCEIASTSYDDEGNKLKMSDFALSSDLIKLSSKIFNADGTVNTESGFVAAGNASGIYASVLQSDGITYKQALIGVGVEETDSEGNSKTVIKLTADNIQLEGLVTANSYFKILEDGSIEAVNGKFTGQIYADNGTIGGWYFGNNYMGSAEITYDSDGNPNVTTDNQGLFLYDSMIGFRTDCEDSDSETYKFAILGLSVAPSTSGVNVLCRLEDTEKVLSQAKYGLYINVQNSSAGDNVAIDLAHGHVQGLGVKTELIGYERVTDETEQTLSTTMLKHGVNAVFVSTIYKWRASSSDDYTEKTVKRVVYLPDVTEADDGYMIWIKRDAGSGTISVRPYTFTNLEVASSSVTATTYERVQYSTFIIANDSDVKTDELKIDSSGDAMCFIFFRDRTYVNSADGLTYYGAWVQWKNPCVW